MDKIDGDDEFQKKVARMAIINDWVHVMTEPVPWEAPLKDLKTFYSRWNRQVEAAALAKYPTLDVAFKKGLPLKN
jgi:hypothetical protein